MICYHPCWSGQTKATLLEKGLIRIYNALYLTNVISNSPLVFTSVAEDATAVEVVHPEAAAFSEVGAKAFC